MIRYPGSKDKIANQLLARFPHSVVDPLWQSHGKLEYREPFFGGGAVGFRAMSLMHPRTLVWINDLDYGMVCLWKAVLESPDELISHVVNFKPSVEAFYDFKEQDAERWSGTDPVVAGFRKFALHQISFSGNGAMAGGPLGGRKQSSEYNVDCRWHATRHCLAIHSRSKLLRKFKSTKITCRDFSYVIDGAPTSTFIYADPPYYKAGPQLYKHAFSDDDHVRLAECLRDCEASWVLSYDDHPRIRELYGWAGVSDVSITYTTAIANGGRRRKNSELVIVPASTDRRGDRCG